MELVLTGTPGPLLGFATTFIATVLEAAGHPTPETRWHDATVIEESVVKAIGKGERRAVLVIDDPLASMATLIGQGYNPQDATRVLTAAASQMTALAAGPSVLLRPQMTIGEAATMLLARLGLDTESPLLEPIGGWDLGATLGETAIVFAPQPPDLSDVLSEIQMFIDEIIQPQFMTAITGKLEPVTWSRGSLFSGDEPGERLPRIIDLTGPARVLAYGPYFHLPPGLWTVRATLAFSPAAVGAPIAVELNSDVFLGRGRFKPPAAGVFEASFQVEVHFANVPVEIRVVNEMGAIEGEVGVDHILLVPQNAA